VRHIVSIGGAVGLKIIWHSCRTSDPRRPGCRASDPRRLGLRIASALVTSLSEPDRMPKHPLLSCSCFVLCSARQKNRGAEAPLFWLRVEEPLTVFRRAPFAASRWCTYQLCPWQGRQPSCIPPQWRRQLRPPSPSWRGRCCQPRCQLCPSCRSVPCGGRTCSGSR